jgi:4-hydroxyphenylacetate 3-monooxygenase
VRTGTDYLASLNDGRRVFVDGAAVDHVQSHPAFAGVSRTVASPYGDRKQSKQGLHGGRRLVCSYSVVPINTFRKEAR